MANMSKPINMAAITSHNGINSIRPIPVTNIFVLAVCTVGCRKLLCTSYGKAVIIAIIFDDCSNSSNPTNCICSFQKRERTVNTTLSFVSSSCTMHSIFVHLATSTHDYRKFLMKKKCD